MLKGKYKNLIILGLMVVLAIVVVYRNGEPCGENCISESDAQFFSQINVSATQAFDIIEARSSDPDFVLLDIRTPEEFKTERIAGAINLDFYADSFRDDLNALDKEKAYLIYCRTGNRTSQALKIMRELGFVEVYNFDGGIESWKMEGFPTITE